MISYVESVIKEERGGTLAWLVGLLLVPLAWLYSLGLKLFLLPYRLGIRAQAHLPAPVISIGNLSVGGTGKTPMTQLICEMLQDHGLKPCVLSRGYRGEHEHDCAVVSDGRKVELTAIQAGDEAHLLANTLQGIPVLVGKDRRESGALGMERFHPDIFVLDDGMQFYQLHRDLDIALVNATRPFENGWTFPRGLLREPPSHIRRAQIIVVTNSEKAPEEELHRLQVKLKRLAPRSMVYSARYEPDRLISLDRKSELTPDWLEGRRVATFCALGNPSGFEDQIERAGAHIEYSLRLGDHQTATMADINTLIDGAQRCGAEAIIVSEKDAVKLPPLGRPIPFFALIVRQKLSDPARFLSRLLQAAGHAQSSVSSNR